MEIWQNLQASLKKTAEAKIKLRVSAASSRTCFRGIMADGSWQINTTAMATKGQANRAIVDFFAEKLKALKPEITIIKGLKAKQKILYIKIKE